MDLPTLWAAILAFAVLAYVVLDGFDLGTGILFPFLKTDNHRDTAMNTVAPIWDGNETWLVLGGGGLFAVFPLAYAIIMPAIYAPLIVMLLALIFRGVAFEYRFRASEANRHLWDLSFFLGSLIAALSQGIALGALVQGIEVDGRAYGGGWFDWFTPFSLMTGVAVATGYALLGATWLMMKTEGPIHDLARTYALRTAVGTIALIGLVSLWMPFLQADFYWRWFSFPLVLFVAPVPLLTLFAAWSLVWSIKAEKTYRPFLSALALFALAFSGLGINFWPNVIPPDVTIWDAAAPDDSLFFLLVGASVLIPLILAYTAYAYWVFRGKVREGEGYHH